MAKSGEQRAPLTGAQVKRAMWAKGTTLKAWAEQHGYAYSLVSNVVRGQNKLTYGQGREIAIKLGMLIPDAHDRALLKDAA